MISKVTAWYDLCQRYPLACLCPRQRHTGAYSVTDLTRFPTKPGKRRIRPHDERVWTSMGVLKPRVFRGRLLRSLTASSTCDWVTVLKSVPLGKYCRNNPLVFSFNPRSHECYGRAKYTSTLSALAMASCPENSVPLSKVMVCR